MAAPTARRHETRAMLRAHLAAASGYRHLTRHCPICHRLLRLAMEPEDPPGTAQGPGAATQSVAVPAPVPALTPASAREAGAAASGGTRESGAVAAPEDELEPGNPLPLPEPASGPAGAVNASHSAGIEGGAPPVSGGSPPWQREGPGVSGSAAAVRITAVPREPAVAEAKGPPTE
ncbi:DUF6274 family protein [Streptomyces albipurpureus]|uniref:DUF6274 family protein n=1 Tax=Streptomyces albipurpureus TaxID=2897419 RepID=UPI003CE57B42